ncbi:MAG TPA: hypothetical protein VGH91_04420 [Gammaproteobacteria bacterium]|jgi:hypothetical protein
MNSLTRLLLAIPRWFGSTFPALTALLAGIGTALDNFTALCGYIKLQLRISTATDGFLDLIAGDYFGQSLSRNPGETDASFRSRIKSNLFAPVVTRAAILARLYTLTGRVATIFEPGNPLDTGGYTVGGCGYGVAGGWGSINMPCQFFVYPKRQAQSGIPFVGGYGSSVGAYSTPSQAEYADLNMAIQGVPDSTIYALINKIRATGITAWVQISN